MPKTEAKQRQLVSICTAHIRLGKLPSMKKVILQVTVVSAQSGYYNLLLERLKYIVTTSSMQKEQQIKKVSTGYYC